MDEMMRVLSRYPNGTYIKVDWDNALLKLGGLIETIYQTDNGLAEYLSEYREYYAAVFRIKDILRNESANTYSPSMVMELSMLSAPSRIKLEDDTVIWENQAS